MITNKEMRNNFKNPPPEFRSVPFWAWNDKLSEKELSSQIYDMKDKGMGGFFIHSREGLETEYMGDEWLYLVKSAVSTAKEAGLNAWLYDEDRFPSGGAGGAVSKSGGDSCRSKALTLEIIRDKLNDVGNNVLAFFKANIKDEQIYSCESSSALAYGILAENEAFLVFRVEVSGPCEWFNSEAPVDNLNPDAVAHFIADTHEIYKKHIGAEFGNTVRGIFTDEPNIADPHSVYSGERAWIPWTDGFAEIFNQKRGYDIIDYLPYIFFNGEKSSKIRHDYWRTITERFCEAYSKQIGNWCKENEISFTGHYLAEHNLGIATRVSGAIMPHYRYQQIPGIDMLAEQTQEYLTVKQCTSVANQYGRRYSISEMYGCTGWDFTFEGQKWVGDWQFVMGINLRCQHHAQYSIKGCRKRDFPPSFNYNNSWWKYNKIVEDYFSRVAAVISEGSAVRDVLVIHPSSTVWSMTASYPYKYLQWNDPSLIEINNYQEKIDGFIKILLGSHYDFDFGDETIIEEKGRVKDNKVYVNNAAYSVVILPCLKTLLDSTAKLLEEFMVAGGKVIALDSVPSMIEGEHSDYLVKLMEHENLNFAKGEDEICHMLERISKRRVSICNKSMVEAEQFLYLFKELPECYTFFIVNNDRYNSHDVMITVPVTGRLEEWNPLNGVIKELSIRKNEDKTSFIHSFGPAGSGLFVIYKNEKPKYENINFKFAQSYLAEIPYGALAPVCKFSRTQPNALLLDVCVFRVGDGEWSEKMFVWQAQRKLRDELGMRQIYYNGLPQRYRWVNEPHIKDGTHVEFKFSFNIEDIPENDTYLAVEMVRNFDICLNGNEVPNIPVGWFIDKSFEKVKLKGLSKGENEVVLSCKYKNSMEIEDCCIIGDFGVNLDRYITNEPDILHLGDWCLQGYFHYSGSIIYHFDFEYNETSNKKLILELGKYNAVTVEVRVNGDTAGHVPWLAANRIDITDFLVQGFNRIDIEVMGSQRNIFGPFHQKGTHNPWVDWDFFERSGSRNEPYYVVQHYGLMEQVKIYIV